MWSDDFPLALIFEELIEIEKPKDKEQEQGTEKTEKDKGGRHKSAAPLFSMSSCTLYAKIHFKRFSAPGISRYWKAVNTTLRAFYGLLRPVPLHHGISAACATCGGLRPPPVLGGSGSAPPPPKGA